jgi:hypothetical protein
MKAVYPPAQVATYDSSFSGASPLTTRWTKLATKAASGPAVTHSHAIESVMLHTPELENVNVHH